MIILPSARGVLGGASDPSFTSVVQLAHFDGTNGSTTFTNSVPSGTTLVALGSGALSTSQSKWGTASLRVGGGTDGADDLSQVAYGFGTGDFTIEYWVRNDAINVAKNMFFFVRNGANYGFYFLNPGQPVYYANAVNRITGSANMLAAATWNFIAYSKVSSNGVLYVDGVSAGSWADTLNYGATGSIYVGRTSVAVSSMIGYIDDLRITKGVGRYTGGTCPVPTAAFPNS